MSEPLIALACLVLAVALAVVLRWLMRPRSMATLTTTTFHGFAAGDRIFIDGRAHKVTAVTGTSISYKMDNGRG